ncbi:hypothetical protein B0H19DRAFT_1082821 [Mycena capillaripes]|nr:hypothetical protein B0H19DRAFT_1082821 [Mycena capillaripes]
MQPRADLNFAGPDSGWAVAFRGNTGSTQDAVVLHQAPCGKIDLRCFETIVDNAYWILMKSLKNWIGEWTAVEMDGVYDRVVLSDGTLESEPNATDQPIAWSASTTASRGRATGCGVSWNPEWAEPAAMRVGTWYPNQRVVAMLLTEHLKRAGSSALVIKKQSLSASRAVESGGWHWKEEKLSRSSGVQR